MNRGLNGPKRFKGGLIHGAYQGRVLETKGCGGNVSGEPTDPQKLASPGDSPLHQGQQHDKVLPFRRSGMPDEVQEKWRFVLNQIPNWSRRFPITSAKKTEPMH